MQSRNERAWQKVKRLVITLASLKTQSNTKAKKTGAGLMLSQTPQPRTTAAGSSGPPLPPRQLPLARCIAGCEMVAFKQV